MGKIIIIGAGASAAIDSCRFPTMDYFFHGILNNAKSEEDKNLVANFFSILDKERIFENRDIECENWGARWYLCIPPNFKVENEKNRIRIRDIYLKHLEKRFNPDNQKFENLEIVLGNAMSTPDDSSAFTSILFMLNWLLGYFDNSIKIKSENLYHQVFNKFIGNEKRCTLVSFNYDLLADKALVTWLENGKKANSGDIKKLMTTCDALGGVLDPSKINIWGDGGSYDPTPSPDSFELYPQLNINGIRLVKPHGSLSLTNVEENKKTNLLFKDNNFAPFPPKNAASDNENRYLKPLIVPPTRNKTRSHPILFEAEEHFRKKLSNPDTKQILIIGWSLPSTDEDHLGVIRECIRSRINQIEELIVIDLKIEKKEKDPYFDRIESIFIPKVMKRYWQGFNQATIENL